MSRGILILGAAAVQEDAVRIAQDLGLRVVVCAMAADGPAAEAADEFHPINILDVDALEALMREQGLDLVYSSGSDLAMPVVGELSQRLGTPSFVSREAAWTCNNKGAMREATKGLDGAVPFQVIADGDPVERHVDLPCIVKPVDAQGQRGVALVTDDTDFAGAVAHAADQSRTRGVIVERFVGGTEISVNGYLVGGELRLCLVTDRETWPQHTGLIRAHVLPSVHVDERVQERVRDLLEAVATRIGITDGPVYAQMKLEDGKPYIIEVTPRFDGCHMWRVIEVATGVNLLRAALQQLADGQAPEIHQPATVRPTTLTFECHAPHQPAPELHADPADVDFRTYYAPGATIRPVNGRYEKIGYHITHPDPA